jgi:hypothetical protein
MAVRDIYLKIERISDYSPVEPDDHVSPPIQYRRDCLRTMGHEDATIPDDEVAARRLTALIYREYLDPQYLFPKPDKLVAADINEPAFPRRVPGTVIYALLGDWLRIHVKNGDGTPHSFHLHGLRYGIDSDGSWPFGTQSDDGRRSDEICPGKRGRLQPIKQRRGDRLTRGGAGRVQCGIGIRKGSRRARQAAPSNPATWSISPSRGTTDTSLALAGGGCRRYLSMGPIWSRSREGTNTFSSSS